MTTEIKRYLALGIAKDCGELKFTVDHVMQMMRLYSTCHAIRWSEVFSILRDLMHMGFVELGEDELHWSNVTQERAKNVEGLLIRYVDHVLFCEGVDFLDNYEHGQTEFSESDRARIKILCNENRE